MTKRIKDKSRLSCRIDCGVKKKFKTAADKRGLDLTSWLIEAGNEKMERENKA